SGPSSFAIVLSEFGKEILHAAEPFVNLIEGSRVGNPHVVLGAEGGAGDHGHMGFVEELLGELRRVRHSILFQIGGDVRIDVERALWLHQAHAGNGAQAFDDRIAPASVFGELTIIIRVLGVMRLAASAAVKAKFFSWSVATST